MTYNPYPWKAAGWSPRGHIIMALKRARTHYAIVNATGYRGHIGDVWRGYTHEINRTVKRPNDR